MSIYASIDSIPWDIRKNINKDLEIKIENKFGAGPPKYVYPFEIAAVILLVAIVAAIALTLRKRKPNKYVDPAEQVKVRRQDRVRMVSMPADNGLD